MIAMAFQNNVTDVRGCEAADYLCEVCACEGQKLGGGG